MINLTHLHLPSIQLLERQYRYEYLKNTIQGTVHTLSFDFTYIHNGHTKTEPNRPVIKIDRSNLLINHESPEETLIGELAYHTSEALFPLRLAINPLGDLYDICNDNEIRQHWKGLLPKLGQNYEARIAQGLIRRIDHLYQHRDKLLKSLQNDWFFTLFFFPMYREYGTNSTISIDYDFPIITGQKVKYKLNLELEREYTENGKIKLLITGESLLTEEDTLSGYFLLNKDRSIHTIDIDFYTNNKEEIKIFVTETKEIEDREAGINLVYDEKEEDKKKSRKSFFIEEITDETNIPKNNTIKR